MDDIIKQACRDLRKNMTSPEKLLWEELKISKLWKPFQRQRPVYVMKEDNWLKRYVIPDFICIPEKLIIEVDWSIHNIPEILELDKYKEVLLENRWYKILRFTNTQIQTNIQNVLEIIQSSFTCSSEKTWN
jgi:very-short-patch-repair endonuclease